MPMPALLATLSLAAASAVLAVPATPILGPCDGCELALQDMPAQPPSIARIAPPEEPGEPMQLSGTVRDADGVPQPGVIIYAHQTGANGLYPGASVRNRHGRLRGWAQTDASGAYGFLTVRPGPYPGRKDPQHIHLFVIEPGCVLYYIDDVMFRDDPRLTPSLAREADRGRGGSGIVTPVKVDGSWQVRRDIVLGQGVPDLPSCAQQAAESPR